MYQAYTAGEYPALAGVQHGGDVTMKIGMLPSERDLELKVKISKLPLWAQDHIKSLEGERETAIRALNEYCDIQTPSPFYCNELESTGEEQGPTLKRRYFQGRRLHVKWGGVELQIFTRDSYGREEIELQWEPKERRSSEVAMIPKSHQFVTLVAKENMR
jgi:hypothetical protein